MGRTLVGFGDVRLSNAEGRRLALHLQIGRLLYAIGLDCSFRSLDASYTLPLQAHTIVHSYLP